MGVLEIWACAADIHRQAQVMIKAEGLLTLAPDTGVPMVNPCLSIANKQALLMKKAAIEMGFTPASRSKVSAATPLENIVDAWSEIVI
jgi:P27 family predicted phage terminase small subunit